MRTKATSDVNVPTSTLKTPGGGRGAGLWFPTSSSSSAQRQRHYFDMAATAAVGESVFSFFADFYLFFDD